MPKRIHELTNEASPVATDRIAIDSAADGARSLEVSALLDLLGIGWAIYDDSTYTSGSPLAVNNAKVQLTCDGNGPNTEKTYLPTGVTDFWNTSTNKITPGSIGDAYDLRIDFTAAPTTSSDWMDLILDIGNGSPDIPIVSRQISFKATGGSKVSVGFPIFSLSTFLTNGGKLYLDTSNSGDNIDVYDIAIFIKRDYKSRV